MRRRDRVLGRLAAEALRERGREALVGRLDRHGDELAAARSRTAPSRRPACRARRGASAAGRRRPAPPRARSTSRATSARPASVAALRTTQTGPRQRAARVGDGDAGTGGAVVEREDAHCVDECERRGSVAPPRRARRRAASGSLPPARAIVRRPPPPPPTSAAAPLTTSEALTLSATASSKFAISVTLPSSTPPSTTAAGRGAA